MNKAQALRYVSVGSHGLTQGQKDAIAEEMVRAEAAGENCCVWHIGAKLAGKPCYCAECRPQVVRYA